MTKILSIGECMIEMRHQDCHFVMGFAGDTYNVAVYLARLGQDVFYFSAVGDDPYSQQMLSAFQSHQVHTDLIEIIPKKMSGLYFVETDAQGERQFFYYRDTAAAKLMLSGKSENELISVFEEFEWIYLSGITLAILNAEDREKLLAVVKTLHKKGAKIVFDTNYRPRLWDQKTAQGVIDALLFSVDVALVTFEDEKALWGDNSAEQTLARFKKAGILECVIKCGGEPAWLFVNDQVCKIPAVLVDHIVDTTAAGDSFNAGYLNARMKGEAPEKATQAGHELAAKVIQYPGAILPK